MQRTRIAIQTNIVRVDGQKSVYLPILKQGGGSNTIEVVNGIREALKHLLDVPNTLVTRVVFDQSVFVKTAIRNLGSEGGIGLVLTALMILIFLGNMRATVAVMLSIPLSALAAFLVLNVMGETINSMVLGGLALAFSRLIDNSVVVLENIFRHLEMGKSPEEAAEIGGREVALPVLAATFTTSIVFFPVVFLYGVSRFLFIALALSVVLSLFASYVVALTVVPLFCAKFIKNAHNEAAHHKGGNPFQRFVRWFNRRYDRSLMHYDRAVGRTLLRPVATTIGVLGIFLFSPWALPAARSFVLSAHGSRAVCDQCKSPCRNAHRIDERIHRAGGAGDSIGYSREGSRHDRLEHRHHAGFFGDLHAELNAEYSLRAGVAEGRTFEVELCVHGSGAQQTSE